MEYEWDDIDVDYPAEYLARINELERDCFVRRETKTICKKDSTSLLTQDPLNDRAGHFYYFCGKNSPFSNFYPARFVVDGVQYNCSEQYMMHQKAVLFKDKEKAQKILLTNDPWTMKRHGRGVRGFDEEMWTKHCMDIVKRGVKAKFKQNPDLEKTLIETFPLVFAEASPWDHLWGIGLGLDDKPQIYCRKTWRGKNWLGFILTNVRNEIMDEYGMFLPE